MASLRFLTAGLLLAIWVMYSKGFRVTRKQLLDNAVIGALLLLGGNGVVSWAEVSVPSGITTLIVSFNPVITVLVEWLVLVIGRNSKKGSAPTLLTIVGLLLGMAGLSLLVGPSLFDVGEGKLEVLPVCALVVACLFWTLGSLYSKYTRDPAESMTGSSLQMLFGGLWLGLFAIAVGEPATTDWSQVSNRSLVAWLYLVVAGSLIAYTTYLWLLKHCTPTLVSTYAYVNPIVAVILGWLILDEVFNLRIALAASVIIVGVGLISYSKSKKDSRQSGKN